MRCSLPVAWVAVLAAGCWSAPGNPQMWDHFSAASDVHDAIVRGNMETARQAGEWLSVRGGTVAVPPGSDLYVAQLREYGARIAEAVDISVAANFAAKVMQTCGDCHVAQNAGPHFLGGGAPPVESTGIGREMRRHGWAAGRLWEGIVGPSTEAWSSGAIALLDAPMNAEDLTDRAVDQPTVRRLENRVHELGRRAAGLGSRDARTALYAELISTCAACHTLVRNR